MPITTHRTSSTRHSTFYRACGPADGPLVIMTHGWPELSISWRHQLVFLGNLGYRAIAPDMRGYGGSSLYDTKGAYAQTEIVQDMIELIDSLGREKAVWIGHDWGSPVAWNIALHHSDRVSAVASLCVPYGFSGHPTSLEYSINRDLYPVDQYPVGQWDYQLHYYEDFDAAQQEMEQNPERVVKLLFRKGDPAGQGQPSATASTRENGGWFPSAGVPDMPIDTDVVTPEDISIYAKHLNENGFFGPTAWYVNGDANQAYMDSAADRTLSMPVLFVHATYDYVCDTTTTGFADPMRALCPNLTEERLACGHWMAQEKPAELNAVLERWLTDVADYPA
jgi:pimeloyl-ACP methyl ester carboxylesterase